MSYRPGLWIAIVSPSSHFFTLTGHVGYLTFRGGPSVTFVFPALPKPYSFASLHETGLSVHLVLSAQMQCHLAAMFPRNQFKPSKMSIWTQKSCTNCSSVCMARTTARTLFGSRLVDLYLLNLLRKLIQIVFKIRLNRYKIYLPGGVSEYTCLSPVCFPIQKDLQDEHMTDIFQEQIKDCRAQVKRWG
jgi:hypothetical protein